MKGDDMWIEIAGVESSIDAEFVDIRREDFQVLFEAY